MPNIHRRKLSKINSLFDFQTDNAQVSLAIPSQIRHSVGTPKQQLVFRYYNGASEQKMR